MQSGPKLGHYEILSAIGKGGMGEVWRARDTKLGREVAIKTLTEEFASRLPVLSLDSRRGNFRLWISGVEFLVMGVQVHCTARIMFCWREPADCRVVSPTGPRCPSGFRELEHLP